MRQAVTERKLTDIELLPLPEPMDQYSRSAWGQKPDLYTDEQLRTYARANVAHHTAAKDAEIDALRTRLEDTVRDSTNEIEALRAEREVIAAEAIKYADKSGRLEARAERLAEALRDALECGEDGDWQSARNYINEALRDHDQEVGND